MWRETSHLQVQLRYGAKNFPLQCVTFVTKDIKNKNLFQRDQSGTKVGLQGDNKPGQTTTQFAPVFFKYSAAFQHLQESSLLPLRTYK